jgi:CBS domain containing-hemolysin-like protein
MATLMINELGRMPKLGDVVETALGSVRIENMARRRITRVTLQLSQDVQTRIKPAME